MNELIKISTKTCNPCKQMSALLKDFDFAMYNTTLTEIDAHDRPEVVSAYGARSVPFFALIDSEGELINKRAGMMTLADMEEFLTLQESV
jgi:thioredoxin-like negative regulator of GroEL